MPTPPIKFSAPDLDDLALAYVRESLQTGHLAGDGPFTQKCCRHLQDELGAPAILTHSGTAALEMAALLLDLGPGDEVIMPSFTFSSTANAVALRGATPVFVDVRPDTLNMDETLLEAAVTRQTRAISVVHYAGVACDMDAIGAFAKAHDLPVVEDAAQAYRSSYKGRPLGTFGTLGCLSFHVTKNVVSGEGGALIVNDPALLQRAYLLAEKGTNRRQFMRGEVSLYRWCDIGSSYLPSDMLAALLLAQLERADFITRRRLEIWHRYHAGLADLERKDRLRRPAPPSHAEHNAHIYFIIMPDAGLAQALRQRMAEAGVPCPHHYIPLHSAPAGQKYGRVGSGMTVTDHAAACMLRLPLHSGLTDEEVDRTLALLDGAIADLHERRVPA